MKALHIVNKLLETDEEGIGDPMQYAQGTNQPDHMIQDTLRKELVEKGWRRIRVERVDNGWALFANVIDTTNRNQWASQGARVAPRAEDSAANRMKIMRSFKAAARRAGMNITDAEITEFRAATGEPVDLHANYANIEDDPGDWSVELFFDWTPVDKFWSKASNAQQAPQPPSPRKPIRSLLTPEQQDAHDESHRKQMADFEQRAKRDTSEWEQRVGQWQRAGGRIEDFPDELR